MCLTTNLMKCVIADYDFVCYKQLRQRGNRYLSPYYITNVELKTVMKTREPDYDVYKNPNYGNKFSVGEGFIHASIVRDNDYFKDENGMVIIKCICRKGTEYYIDDDAKTICARELYITDEVINQQDIPLFDRENLMKVFSPIIDNVDTNGVSVGDYFLSDHTFVHAKNYYGQKKAIGVVGYITDEGEAIITAFKQKCLAWSDKDEFIDNLKTVNSYEDAYNDMNGRNYTRTVIESKQYSEENYPAFAYVSNYNTEGTKKGDWYLSAPGELNETVAKNMLTINISLVLLNDNNVDLIDYGWYWVSAECRQNAAWLCNTAYASLYRYYSLKRHSYYVRPSLAFKINENSKESTLYLSKIYSINV